MIVRVRRGSVSEETQEEYFALQRNMSGDWIPLAPDPDESADAAIRRCVAGVQKRLAELEAHTERETEIMRDNLERLWDTAQVTDVVRIGFQVCPVDESGMLTMPASTPSPRLRDKLATMVTDEVYKVVRKSVKLPRKRDRAQRMIVDLTLNSPLEILKGVSEYRPDALGAVAAFMAEVSKAMGSQDSDEEKAEK